MSSPLPDERANQTADTTPPERQPAPVARQSPKQTQPTAPAQQSQMVKVLVVLVGGIIAIWYFSSHGGFVSAGLYIGVGMLAVILVAMLFGKRP